MFERVFALGVDPGLSRCGYGVVGRTRAGLAVSSAGVIRTPTTDPLASRLASLFAEMRRLLAEVEPDVVVVERVLFQANARTAMAVGQASGVALVAAAEAGCPVVMYSPNEVKQAVTGYGSATKEQVQRMVQSLLRLPERPRPPDVADALALAICHLTGTGLRAAVAAAGGTP
ncbi:MAG: crossover junction endodeoxyribonuclease RuvC [Acidimicrobiaceae bacterium]|jgi:crossover junction endodeoxyribonuclease RuvC|nr:crossover junction endodeoxyribonuclease RuvC [Acidimicrobiaceae bacterium]MDQ1378238.1 crossover junction endodeoxyribonuclease RuvC [Acidimicrobiaceae bacterium]MDQ1398290.1 crossover junction endodeoxyribonuclease RuvC [Acidimicrobiaceae bacterium]MDQ1411943.1 crossover junction endodeoxyribonuclease RuvC [Acidimicrobiaceae bacterium]MDQ1414767.1 crossover junction endodeoxyribonuclease RuvC [Acidimicrobiaceae bacterium]